MNGKVITSKYLREASESDLGYNPDDVTYNSILGKRVIVADIEANGIFNVERIWCLAYDDMSKGGDKILVTTKEFKDFLKNPEIILEMHNGLCYDKRVLEEVLGIEVKCEFIDTLALSYYLYPTRVKHGLEEWGEFFGVPKPKIIDWDDEDLLDEYCYRCQEDVKINVLLWKKMVADLNKLYGKGKWLNAVIYLSTYKADKVGKQEVNEWKFDREGGLELLDRLGKLIEVATSSLESAMPKVAKYKKIARYKKLYLKDGKTLSAQGLKWKNYTEELGLPFEHRDPIKILDKYEEPNAGSPQQIKDWLYGLGWKPCTFKFTKDSEGNSKSVPQVRDTDTGEVVASLKVLQEDNPEISYLNDLGVLKHRYGLVTGLAEFSERNGYVIAGYGGLTNTLRLKHRTCVNLPAPKKPWGKEIRGLFVSRSPDKYELLGSDMSSLEDRTKQHFMWEHDPEYVRTMQKAGFDPHLDIAQQAGMLTVHEVTAYKYMKKKDIKSFTGKSGAVYNMSSFDIVRHKGKTTNYASTYGAAAKTIARSAGVVESEGYTLHDAYWTRNWSIKKIAELCEVKTCNGIKWLLNPVNGIWYYLKKEKDRFSTLNQGTGAFCFDMWVHEISKEIEEQGLDAKMLGQFHDEVIVEVLKGQREFYTDLLKTCVRRVNEMLKLNRDLDIDVDFGDNYAEIH